MTVLVVIVVVVLVVWCVVSVFAALVFGRVVVRADRDAELQQRAFERDSTYPQTHTAA